MPLVKLEKLIKNARAEVFAPPTRIKAELLSYAKAYPFRRSSFLALRYVAGISAAALLGVTGTVFAAQQALPGQPLYSLKRVSETAYVNLQPSPQAKAQANELLIGRRISEAVENADFDAEKTGAEDVDAQLSVDSQLAFDAAVQCDAWIDAQDEIFSLPVDRNL